MPTAQRYRAKATEYRELRETAHLPSEVRQYRNLEHSYVTLADNAQWLIDNREKIHCPGADDGLYGDVFRVREEENAQQKTAVGPLATAAPMPAAEVLTKVELLFDDAVSRGGLLQTDALRGRLTRFLKRHQDDDFR
jgi:hypothetical protein